MKPTVAVVGGGPAGLMAAEVLATAGVAVTVYERMPTVGRKLQVAGRGGLNLTHSEPLDAFLDRYGPARTHLAPPIERFGPDALRAWSEGLGEATFVGSSGRVFPEGFRATTLLRAWLRRLDELGVELRTRHTWHGWTDDGALFFTDRDGTPITVTADATVLAPRRRQLAPHRLRRRLGDAPPSRRRRGPPLASRQQRLRGGLERRVSRSLRRHTGQGRRRASWRGGGPG